MIRNTRLVFSHNELSKLTMMNHQMDYRTLRRAIFTKNLYNFSAFTTYLQDSARKISNVLYFFYSKMIMLIVVVFLFSRKFILKLLTRSLLFIVYYVHTISPGRCVLELSLASEDMQTKVTRLRFISTGQKLGFLCQLAS